MAWLSLLIFWMGCRPVVSEVEASLVVLDANDAPPDSGFALLVREVAFHEDGSPLDWEAVSDTLCWSPTTGEITLSHQDMPKCHWLICSNDPVSTDRLRTSLIPAVLLDTCRLDVYVPYHLLLRIRQSEQSNDTWSVVFRQDQKEDTLLHEISQPGGYRFRGHIAAHSFPLHLGFIQENESNGVPKILDSIDIEFQGAQTIAAAAWSNFEDTEL